eukprot:COSAG02_NODE_856_length_16468_cov_131.787831_10_plen_170_part_00
MHLCSPGHTLEEIGAETGADMAVDDENTLFGSQGSAIDLTAEDDTNAVCRQCNLPFYTASGNPECVDCRDAVPSATAAAGRDRRTALSPRSPNSAVPSSTATAAGRCNEPASSFPTAAATGIAAAVTGATVASMASSAQADQAGQGQEPGLGGWVYSAAAGMLGRLASQ